jgi:hypothetical protein
MIRSPFNIDVRSPVWPPDTAFQQYMGFAIPAVGGLVSYGARLPISIAAAPPSSAKS